ncbi:hypothetical protein KHA80_16195 [Anaerobacillus sp. HL2]|nr:hypothetical protein KHA80_16195 [Anaerobacillus sp. HL2]
MRKKGIGIQPPNQALLAELPSFSHKQSLTEMINSMNNWFDFTPIVISVTLMGYAFFFEKYEK